MDTQLILKKYTCKIRDKDKKLIEEIKMALKKVFMLPMLLENNMSLKDQNSEASLLWHLRYGHLYYHKLRPSKQKNGDWTLLTLNFWTKHVNDVFMIKCIDYLFLRLLGEQKNLFNIYMLTFMD